tara:strand:+ start:911 stop:1105 length:195 start_codon:yes stop_codon:yes gene_type:complete
MITLMILDLYTNVVNIHYINKHNEFTGQYENVEENIWYYISELGYKDNYEYHIIKDVKIHERSI